MRNDIRSLLSPIYDFFYNTLKNLSIADSIGSHLPTISLARKRFAVLRLEHREILCGISARWADLDGALRTKLPEGSYNPALLPHADAEE